VRKRCICPFVRDLVRTHRLESPSRDNYLCFFLSGDSEEASGQVKGIDSICSDRDASLLKKLKAGEDLYPFCDASVWLRSCLQEVVEPLEGKITGKSPRTRMTLVSHIFPFMFATGLNEWLVICPSYPIPFWFFLVKIALICMYPLESLYNCLNATNEFQVRRSWFC
jgi:hypothetical protein